MKIRLKNIYAVLKTAFNRWWSKDFFRESAVISYYSIFSLPGLLVLILSIAGYFFGNGAANDYMTEQFTSTMGADTAEQIRSMIIQSSETEKTFWAVLIGVITILVGATGVFAQFQESLNKIWEVKADENRSEIWYVIRVRLFSFGLIVSIAFLLIVSLAMSAGISALNDWVSGNFPESLLIVFQVVNYILSLVVLTVLFSLFFKVLPDAEVKWKHVWIGSLVTAFLFNIGKFALGLYFAKASPGIGYGTAGSIILIMLWVSYSSMIVFYGAEFTRAYADLFPGKVPPTDIAKTDVQIKTD